MRDDGNDIHGFVDSTTDAQDYWYDANGNMVRDLNKGIGTFGSDGITYNHLNLPKQVAINNSEHNGNIQYIYDATGTKLRKIATDTGESSVTTTDYAGNYIYENTGSGSQLQFFSHPEGYVSAENGSYKYVYQYKDHLGNIRLSYTDEDRSGDITVSSDPLLTEIVEENNYYPFGLQHKGYNNVINGNENDFHTYNGKEHDKSLSLNWHDYGARRYDASLGRWMSVDPIADDYVGISPYAYVANSPIVAIDPDGERIIFVNGYIGGGSAPAGAQYWNGRGYNPNKHLESTFVRAAKTTLNDNDTYYTNESFKWYQTAYVRQRMGRKYAKENLKKLTQGLDKNKDVFHFVTHSMGGAYAEGIKEVLEEEGWKVGVFAALSTYEAEKMNFKEGDEAFIIDYKDTNDPVLKNFSGFGDGMDEIGNADLVIRDKSKSKLTFIHKSSISGDKFWKTVNKLVQDFLNEDKKKKEDEDDN